MISERQFADIFTLFFDKKIVKLQWLYFDDNLDKFDNIFPFVFYEKNCKNAMIFANFDDNRVNLMNFYP